ncbi:DNA adenine methylase [Acinetobacter junii]|uniref:DNA adenine methylase n=1 Tax=Acinetobacter junii TaxID=40215 RepID=UPI001FB1FEF8|nr:Dam family site-specific DNA-(adenine-N6)-methyltransferase [Acinetobacter junii]UOB51296.1 Dam family site-specific DNA-(adenine-N6)-methyltransferase [Acinetobacter junii]
MLNNSEKMISPFLKWAGGKRWFVKNHLDNLPNEFNVYLEPFLGGASMFFAICPKQAILSDYNANLINCYLAIKEAPKDVYEYLEQHHFAHNKEYYYDIRKTKYVDKIQKAAQFIYLNRTCWNALYRVNLKGEFNVPIGTKTNVILETDNFEELSKILQYTQLKSCDFEETINKASENDFIFVDPPYTVKHNNNGFVKYNETMFSWDDQIRLSEALISAHSRGAKFLMTNAYHQSVIDLYEDNFNLSKVSRHSVIASESSRRGLYDELLVKNY